MKTEYRFVPIDGIKLERRDDGVAIVTGHAAVFDQPSVNLGGFREEIEARAFDQTLADDDQVALWSHDRTRPLGRRSAGTLTLGTDKRGLTFELELPDTTVGKDAVVNIERGDVQGMSIGMAVIDDKFIRNADELDTRIVKEAKLIEVSPVVFPAYPQTDVGVVRAALARALAGDSALQVELRDALEGVEGEHVATDCVRCAARETTREPPDPSCEEGHVTKFEFASDVVDNLAEETKQRRKLRRMLAEIYVSSWK